MDLTGVRWSLNGAEAVCRLRALRANSNYDNYVALPLRQKHQRNYALAPEIMSSN